jgi:hypothetical protein
MSIFRETLQKDIKASLENRQKAMTRRNTNDIQYLNSRNVWIRMASSVDVNGKPDLAKQYVLQGGTLYNNTLRSGITEKFADGGAYSISGSNGPYRLGIRPMPGITGVEIKSKSAYGSLREATVNFQCWDIAQLEDLELLYMRPGYTVLLEWGWAPYLDVNGNYQSTFTDFYTDKILNPTTPADKDRTKIFKALYDNCTKYGGNYDAVFGYIKNYNWSARADGGYDCTTTIITTGEVIESIKVNYVRKDLASYKMYDTSSVGNGFLDSLFTAQGSTPSTKFAEYYQKNTLAGVWAELNYKLKDPNTTLSSTGSAILGNKIIAGKGDKYNVLKFQGLTNYGDFNSFIEPGSPFKTFITLEAAFDVINEFILTKAEKDTKSLITLSTKVDGSADLQCVAHPVQISIDPTVCMIKSPLWYDQISPLIKTATTGAAVTTNVQADTIARQLIDASSGDDVEMSDFLTAIRLINNPTLYVAINDIFKRGTYSTGATTTNGAGAWQYASGFQGLLEEQFITKNSQLARTPSRNNISAAGGVGVPFRWKGSSKVSSPNLVSVWWLYIIQKNLPSSSGINISINLTADTGYVNTTFDAIIANSRNTGVTLDFSGATLNPYQLANLKDVDGTDFVAAGTGRFAGAWSTAHYTIQPGGVAVSAPPAAAVTAAALVLNTADAVGIIEQMELLEQEFFIKSFPTSTGSRQDCIDAELGYIGNIYVSLDYLYRQSLNVSLEASDTKEKNEINLYSYIKGITSGIQVSIGNLNNFEIHVDPIDNNVARVIDINYAERTNPPPLFELEVYNLNSIVRSYNLQSQIFPNQSSIIAIGSQAQGGGQGAIQNKTMVSFNDRLTDRILGDKTDPDDNGIKLEDLAALLSSIVVLYSTFGANIQPDQTNNLNFNEAISRAKNALRDLIVYFQILDNSPSANRNILPFKFSFEMDGTGGLIIGNLFKITPDDVIPKGYRGVTAGVKLAQTITGISHTLQNNDWITKVDALNIILERLSGCFNLSNLGALVSAAVNVIIQNGLGLGIVGGGAGGGTCGDKTDRTGKWVSLVYEPYVRTTVNPTDVVNYLKRVTDVSVRRAAYAIFANESGRGSSGVNQNYIGLQTDGGGFISTDTNYVKGTTSTIDSGGRCRAFATYATWQRCIDHLVAVMDSRKQGKLSPREMVPLDPANASFFGEGYARNWVANLDPIKLAQNKATGISLWNEAISKGL